MLINYIEFGIKSDHPLTITFSFAYSILPVRQKVRNTSQGRKGYTQRGSGRVTKSKSLRINNLISYLVSPGSLWCTSSTAGSTGTPSWSGLTRRRCSHPGGSCPGPGPWPCHGGSAPGRRAWPGGEAARDACFRWRWTNRRRNSRAEGEHGRQWPVELLTCSVDTQLSITSNTESEWGKERDFSTLLQKHHKPTNKGLLYLRSTYPVFCGWLQLWCFMNQLPSTPAPLLHKGRVPAELKSLHHLPTLTILEARFVLF